MTTRKKSIWDKIKSSLDYRWNKFKLSVSRPKNIGARKEWNNPKIIVSLTSFPARIKTVHKCIKTLLNQTVIPDILILWLSESQFPKKDLELPRKLLALKKYGLDIGWCDDIKSYKKLIPSLELFPSSTIVTADDDVYYPQDWLFNLISANEKNPGCVCCYRAAIIYPRESSLERINPRRGNKYEKPTFLHQPTGVGGVLYPPGVLFKEVTNKKAFMTLAKTNDDIWFWAMSVLNKTKVLIIGDNEPPLYYVGSSQKVSLTSINDRGTNYYNTDFARVINEFPDLFSTIEKEYKLVNNKVE